MRKKGKNLRKTRAPSKDDGSLMIRVKVTINDILYTIYRDYDG